MSLTVVDHHDGTYTISCGDESQTVGVRRETTLAFVGETESLPMMFPPAETDPNPFPEAIPKNPAGMSVRIAEPISSYRTIHFTAASMDEASSFIAGRIHANAGENMPLAVSMLWEGKARPDTAKISNMLTKFGGQSLVGLQVHLPLSKKIP